MEAMWLERCRGFGNEIAKGTMQKLIFADEWIPSKWSAGKTTEFGILHLSLQGNWFDIVSLVYYDLLNVQRTQTAPFQLFLLEWIGTVNISNSRGLKDTLNMSRGSFNKILLLFMYLTSHPCFHWQGRLACKTFWCHFLNLFICPILEAEISATLHWSLDSLKSYFF